MITNNIIIFFMSDNYGRIELKQDKQAWSVKCFILVL